MNLEIGHFDSQQEQGYRKNFSSKREGRFGGGQNLHGLLRRLQMEKISSIKCIGIRGGGRGVAVLAFFFAVILSCSLFATAANAEPQADIVAQATADYAAGQSLQDVITHALASATAAGVALENLAPALAETLMEAGIKNGADGVVLAGQVAEAMLCALTGSGTDTANTLRAISQMVEGIRAAADRHGLNAELVRGEINKDLSASACAGELGVQLAQVVDAAYLQAHAETYTAPPVARANPLVAPASVGSNVANAFSPTASTSTKP